MDHDTREILRWLVIPGVCLALSLALKFKASKEQAAFRIRLIPAVSAENPKVKVLIVEAHGRLRFDDGTKCHFVIKAFDVTDPRIPMAVHCTVPGFSTGPENFLFMQAQPAFRLKESRIVGEWTQIGVVPLQDIQCPYSGERTLEVEAAVINENPNPGDPLPLAQVVTAAKAHATAEISMPGYKETPGKDWGRPDPGRSRLN